MMKMEFKFNVTNVLIISYAVFFIGQLIYGVNQSIFQFGLSGIVITQTNEYWRILTSSFIHVSFFHVFMNAYFIYIIGNNVEEMLGKTRYIVLVLFTILTSGLAVILLDVYQQNMVFTVGASGFGYGLVGLIVAFAIMYPNRYYKSLAISLVSNLLFYTLIFMFISNQGISWIGHFGGFIGGLIMGGILNAFFKKDEW